MVMKGLRVKPFMGSKRDDGPYFSRRCGPQAEMRPQRLELWKRGLVCFERCQV